MHKLIFVVCVILVNLFILQLSLVKNSPSYSLVYHDQPIETPTTLNIELKPFYVEFECKEEEIESFNL